MSGWPENVSSRLMSIGTSTTTPRATSRRATAIRSAHRRPVRRTFPASTRRQGPRPHSRSHHRRASAGDPRHNTPSRHVPANLHGRLSDRLPVPGRRDPLRPGWPTPEAAARRRRRSPFSRGALLIGPFAVSFRSRFGGGPVVPPPLCGPPQFGLGKLADPANHHDVERFVERQRLGTRQHLRPAILSGAFPVETTGQQRPRRA